MAKPKGLGNDHHGLNLDDPRMIAALKVTGMKASDIEIEPAPLEGACEKDLRRYEVMERKRFNLLQDLREAAESLDIRDIDALISGPGRVDASAVFMSEKARIDRQRERARFELQRKAALEVERQQVTIRSARDWETMTKRLAVEKEEKAKKEAELMEAKRLKVENNMKAAKEKQSEERRRILSKLKDQDDRVSKNLEALQLERDARSGAVQERAEVAARRLQEHEEKIEEAAWQKHHDNTNRTQALEGWMDRRQNDWMDRRSNHQANFSDRLQKLDETQQAEHQKRESAADKNLKRLHKAREHAKDNWLAVAENTKAKRTQRLEKWTLNKQAKNMERFKRAQQIKSDNEASDIRSRQLVTEYREATIGRYTAVREIYNELVQDNKERIDRSGDNTREHRIGRINHQKACFESVEDQKKEASTYRVNAFRERVVGQTQVEELHYLLNLSMRSETPSRKGGRSPTNLAVKDRVNAILTDLGVPIPVDIRPEGEEAEGGQSAANGRGHGEGGQGRAQTG